MKIQIDTTAKTIKIGQNVKFSELIPALDALFPNDGWKEYELQTEHITQNINPVIVRPWWSNPYPNFYVTSHSDQIYCTSGTAITKALNVTGTVRAPSLTFSEGAVGTYTLDIQN